MHFLLCAIDKRSDTGIDYRGISAVIVTIMTNKILLSDDNELPAVWQCSKFIYSYSI